MNAPFPPLPFARKGMTMVRGLCPLADLLPPWGGPAEAA